jgi:hypothetical protein
MRRLLALASIVCIVGSAVPVAAQDESGLAVDAIEDGAVVAMFLSATADDSARIEPLSTPQLVAEDPVSSRISGTVWSKGLPILGQQSGISGKKPSVKTQNPSSHAAALPDWTSFLEVDRSPVVCNTIERGGCTSSRETNRPSAPDAAGTPAGSPLQVPAAR